MNKATYQELRLQQGGNNNEPIEEIRLASYRERVQEYDALLLFVTIDNGVESIKHRFALSPSDAILLITHLKNNFNL